MACQPHTWASKAQCRNWPIWWNEGLEAQEEISLPECRLLQSDFVFIVQWWNFEAVSHAKYREWGKEAIHLPSDHSSKLEVYSDGSMSRVGHNDGRTTSSLTVECHFRKKRRPLVYVNLVIVKNKERLCTGKACQFRNTYRRGDSVHKSYLTWEIL